eukprot:1318529-Pyramimonas_sp.AAC.1
MPWICAPMIPKPLVLHIESGSGFDDLHSSGLNNWSASLQGSCRRSAIDSAWQGAARVEACAQDNRESLQMVRGCSNNYETMELMGVREECR